VDVLHGLSGALFKGYQSLIGRAAYSNWTAVGVNWLAEFDFEITVIARIPG